MKKVHWVLVAVAVIVAAVAVPRAEGPAKARPRPTRAAPPASRIFVPGPLQPLPATVDLDARAVELGRRLFHDEALSLRGDTSCATCHDPSAGGIDGRDVARRADGTPGALNVPSVLNCSFNFRQGWTGGARTLDDHVERAMSADDELASDWEHVVATVAGDARYRAAFDDVYGHVDADAIREAIATYGRSLVTPNSRFDLFLLGDADALTDDERAGYQLFLDAGCVSCHQGTNVGGNMFQRFGKFGNYFEDRGELREVDLGRYAQTGREEDRFRFRVPSLRNVDVTAPYLHDGSIKSLDEVVQLMARYELGTELAEDEVRLLVTFLRCLTGEGVSDH